MATNHPGSVPSLYVLERLVEDGARRLRFPGTVEDHLEAETGHARCRRLLANGILGLIIFHVALIYLAHRALPGAGSGLVTASAPVTVPVLAALILLSRNPRPWLRESLAALVGAFLAAGVAIQFSAGHGSAGALHFSGPVLAILFVNLVLRPRFRYALAATAATFAALVAALAMTGTPFAEGALPAGLLVAASVLTLLAAYDQERTARRDYVAGLRARVATEHAAEAAGTDPVTGIASRATLDRASAASGAHVAAIMVEIDRFTAFVDGYGRHAAEVCLARVASLAAAQCLDDGDLAARYGEDRIVLLLACAGEDDALRTAERLRAGVEAMDIPHEFGNSGNRVTVTTGVAAASAGKAMPGTALIDAAGSAMHAARPSRGNVISPASAPASPGTAAIPASRSILRA